MYKWRIYCETDGWLEVFSDTEPTECPNNPGHTLRDLTSIIEKADNYYEIQEDVDNLVKEKDYRQINYKSELLSGVSYTPVFIIHDQGNFAGLIDRTEYYRGYIDQNNKGILVLVVEEAYTIDDSDPTKPFTARPAIERTKTWKHVKRSDGQIDSDPARVKVKTKKYNTRAKSHTEGNRRRANIVEQLIDNVGLAGVVSGTFADVDDAHDKLVELQELHSSSFSGWKNSGRGSLIDVIQSDATTTWLDDVIPDTAGTQAMVPWMIGVSFRSYIQDKLKGNIK
jgi:hypothetical protein